ncbi:MAG: nitrilase-related carbon-nitrogen hydrolase [Candidatus Methylomirabilota bacterium]
MRRLRLGLAQIAPTLGDLEKNLALHERLVREAEAEAVDLLVFPELSLTGYFLSDQVSAVALRRDSAPLRALGELSRRLSLVAGFVEETPDHRFHNSAAYFEDGTIRHLHRKVYLPTYGIFDEERDLAAGGAVRAFETALGRVAILICEDLWHPAVPALAAWDGAEILICPSSSPGRGTSDSAPFQNSATWERMLRTYGDLFTCFVAYTNRVGFEDGACFWGGSELIDPSGRTLVKAPYLDAALVVADLEPGALRRARLTNPLLRDERLEFTLQELTRIIRARADDPGR